ncbi:MAG: DEAD/DEAH box helicase family protein [Verrucomicrobia bacterium]|nr:DEAD/DEAH box helicase family protein [Verrucomicrobiota bacterium]
MKEKNSKQQLLALIFSEGGLLSRSLKNYEERVGQKEMSLRILDAYQEDSIALIEAGTGTGKSLAYLVPAVYWALKHQEKTVITTHTIALQEQLLLKDIPFLLKTMDVDLKACLVKGMGNYLCLRKLRELQDQPLLFSMEETKEVQAIEQWSEKTNEGSRSDIPFPVSPATWEKVAAEGEACNHVHCPHYKECFFFKARKEAADSQILIVNHHLLLADIEKRRRNPGQESILPLYNRLVIDEAHNLEDIALESFAQRFERIAFLRQLAKLHSDSHPERSRLMLLRQELSVLSAIPPTLLQKLEIDIPAQKRVCQTQLEEAFAELSHFFETHLADKPFFKEKESKKRITDGVSENPFWKETIVKSLLNLAEEIQRLSQMLNGILTDLEEFKGASFYEKLSIHLLEIQAIAQRLEQCSAFLEQFTQDEPKEKRVRWFESNGSNVILVDAALDISAFLTEHLFSQQRTSVLCSATIATAKSFSFLKKRLGLVDYEEKLMEEIYESPFNYQERALFVVPTDLPAPSSPNYLAECIKAMQEAIEISKGSVFLLFTSYDMLQNCYRSLSSGTLPQRYPFLKQGDLPRHLLLEQFKKKEGSVLFATDSFWEGVDVPGEALRCVVIAKLPFSVPSDPLYEAYSQSLEKEGLDPFSDYSVPQAVIKFKQGFGRLMRKHDDRGCVICLDHRIVKKNYGKQFLDSLPPCKTCFASKAEAFAQMRQFYEKTRKK